MKIHVLIAILLSLTAFDAAAKKLYKYQDSQGVWHFTDKPPNADEKVTVRQLKAAPRQMVWLNQSGKEQHAQYSVRNDYEGPVEIEVDFAENTNAQAMPPFPIRFTIPTGVSDPLFEIGAIDAARSWAFALKFRYVPGRPLENFRTKEPYYPPIEPESSFQITQAFGGTFSHQDEQNRYAVDIAMPEGTPVHAARSGVVMEVEDDFFKGGVNQAYRNEANSIRILHDDGSMAIYAHLELEKAQVHAGLKVATGQLLGYSGNTGFSSGPHLHFAVQYNEGMKLVSAPFTFRTPTGQDQEPAAGAWLKGLTPTE